MASSGSFAHQDSSHNGAGSQMISGSIDPFSAMVFQDEIASAAATTAAGNGAVVAEESALFLVEAQYAYAGSESNHLGFDKGDIIEVWGQEASGWWDGFLRQSKNEINHEKRGWFPSNYVRPLSAEASEAVRRLLDIQLQLASSSPRYGQANGHPSDEPEVDVDGYMTSGPSLDILLGRRPGELSASDLDQVLRWGGGNNTDTQMLDMDEDLTSFSAGGDIFGEIAAAAAESHRSSQPGSDPQAALAAGLLPPHAIVSQEQQATPGPGYRSDPIDADWVPKVSTDGRVFAYNTRTGDSAMEFPSPTASSSARGLALSERIRADSGTGVSDKSKWMSGDSTASRAIRAGDSTASRAIRDTYESSSRGVSASTMPTSTSMPALSTNGIDSREPADVRPASMYSDGSALDTCLSSFRAVGDNSHSEDASATPRKNTLATDLEQKLVIQQSAQDLHDDHAARKKRLQKLLKLAEATPARTLEQYQHDCEDALGLLTDAVQIHASSNAGNGMEALENEVLRRQRLEEAAEGLSTATRQLLVATDTVLEHSPQAKRISSSSAATSDRLSMTSTVSGRTSMQVLETCPALVTSEFRPMAMKITATESKLILSIRALWGLLETSAAEDAASDLARETECITPEEKAAHSKKRAALLITRRDIDAKLRYDLLVQVRALGEAYSTFIAAVEDFARRKGIKPGRAALLLPKRSEASFAAEVSGLALPAASSIGAWQGHGYATPARSEPNLTTPIAQHFSSLSSSAGNSNKPYRPLVLATLNALQMSREALSENLSGLQTLLRTLCGPNSDAALKPSLLPTVTKQTMQLLTRLAAFLRELEEIDLAGRLDVELDMATYAALTGQNLEQLAKRGIFLQSNTASGTEEYAGSLRQAVGFLADLTRVKRKVYDAAPELVLIMQRLSLSPSPLQNGSSSMSAGNPFVSPINTISVPEPPAPDASISDLFRTFTAIDADTAKLVAVVRDMLLVADEQAAAAPELRKINMALRADLAALSMPESSTSSRPSRLSRISAGPGGGLGLEDENAEELDSTRTYGTNGLDGSATSGSLMYASRGMNDSRTGISSSGQMQRTASVQSSLYRQALGGRPSRSNSLAESFISEDSYRGGSSSAKREAFEQEAGLAGTSSPTNHSPSKSKLKQFFGADAPGQNIHRPPTANKEMPVFLQSDYTHEQISYSNDGSIRAGTLHALVCRLTNHMSADRAYNDAFLMTYRTFCTSEEVLSRLKDRYNIEPPPGMQPGEYKLWVEQKQKLVRIRVVGVLKSWITENLYDDDDAMLDQISAFAVVLPGESSQQLARIIERRKLTGAPRRMTASVSAGSAPPPIVPRNLKKIKFLDVDPLEIARQFTVMDSKLFSRITVDECLSKAWPKKLGNTMPNFTAIADISNAVTGWVAMSIVTQPDIRRRAAIVKHFIAVADKCRSLSNFTTLVQIVAGLNCGAIYRLKRTWELVNQRSMSTLTYLGNLMSPENNYALYRDALRLVGSPCVPFLGVYFTDWVMSGEANTDYLRDKPDQINFAKRSRVAESIQSIQINQATPYNLTAVPALVKWIAEELNTAKAVGISMAANAQNGSPASSLNSEMKSPPPTVDILAKAYEISLKIEPREREDERSLLPPPPPASFRQASFIMS